MSSKAKPFLDLYTPEANNFTVPDLITHLQSTFIPYDFDLVTRILSAREDQAKKDHSLLEENHAALQDELKSCKKANDELKEEMLMSKDEYESCIVELRGRIECMERDEEKTGTLVKLYRSRFEKLIMRVIRLEDNAKVLLMSDQSRAEEEAMEHNGESQGQLTEEIDCSSKEKKKAELGMPIEIDRETEAVSKTHGVDSTRVVIDIIDSDYEQPMGVKASAFGLRINGVSPFGCVDHDGSRSYSQDVGGEIMVPQDSNITLKMLCGSQLLTAPTTSPSNDIETSGTLTMLNSGVLKSYEENMNSEQSSEYFISRINKYACDDSSSDYSEDDNDNGDWKNEEDMIMALEEDPELCMRAICALYREKSFNGLELHNTQYEDMTMAFEKDPELCMKAICARRGTALAELIINGDPRAQPNTSSITELQKDEKGLRDCKRIVKVYSKKLFEIYKKGNYIVSPFL